MPSAARNDTFTSSDGTPIAFTHRAAPLAGAPRVALIHSLALDRSVWDSVAALLEDQAEVLTYDCRGHGLSDRHPGEYSAQLFARDLAELLDHLVWPNAVVAGCSMGGNVAQAFAVAWPERTAALGLIDTTAWYGPDAARAFGDRAEAARSKGMAGLIEFQLTRWFSDEFRAGHADVLRRVGDVFVANDLDCYAASCGLLGAVDMRPSLARFQMPVAVVVGEDDHATPVTMARHLHESIPQSTLTIVPHARHLTPIECPDRVALALRGLFPRM